jgi:hypothetical protein
MLCPCVYEYVEVNPTRSNINKSAGPTIRPRRQLFDTNHCTNISIRYCSLRHILHYYHQIAQLTFITYLLFEHDDDDDGLGWFFGAPFESIYLENVYDWIAWAMFSLKVEDMNRSERAEMEVIVARMEDKVGHKFPPSRNPAVTCARLTLGIVLILSPFVPIYLSISTITD